jgi:macrodomain Ter protein organizer (MatP/YcbG family)
MTGHDYIIRQQDRNAAVAFIDDQISKNPQWLNEIEAQRIAAEQEYQEIKADPTSFNAWCRKWLNETQWAQIKEAICTARDHQQESLKYAQPSKTVSLTHHAWQILSDLARQDDITLSEVIINRLGGNRVTVYTHTESRYNSTVPTNRQVRS